MTKPKGRISVREQKAEALDVFVKDELARTKALNAAKTAKLKALRLARDGQGENPAAPHQVERKTGARKTMHLPRSS